MPPMTMPFIDLANQYRALRTEIDGRIARVLEHGQYIMGPEVEELEERLALFTGARHCITVSSGTDALLISLMSLGIGPGDEVITTPFSFIATAEVIVLLGATPVFVDVCPETCNIDAAQIEARITDRTRAILPVGLYGQPPDMERINAIAHAHGDLPVIEDAAQSFGARLGDRRSCNLGTIGCTSFFPSKPLGCYGDGGAIFTNDAETAQRCRELRVHGQSERYVHTRVGVGGRMDTIQCAVVLAKLDRFDQELQQREQVAARYRDIFAAHGVEASTSEPLSGPRPLPWPAEDRTSVFAQYTIRTPNRSAVQQKLKKHGIPTAVHYPKPINEQPAYAHLCCADCTPVARVMAAEVLSLPMHPELSDIDQRRVVDALFA